MYYLCGKITDDTREKEQANLQKFYDLEKELVENRGFEVFNPARFEQDGLKWEDYLAKDLLWIYTNRPTLYLVDERWKQSKGARLEIAFAKLIGLHICEPL